ncbi:hypothetical protein VTJ04DRAFT_10654 [Mycothermus thermophilus]|uniref:uncharacterized protein n=1 Tax=Humicola insolens TaxID=85995 RepID=UPI0037441A27
MVYGVVEVGRFGDRRPDSGGCASDAMHRQWERKREVPLDTVRRRYPDKQAVHQAESFRVAFRPQNRRRSVDESWLE